VEFVIYSYVQFVNHIEIQRSEGALRFVPEFVTHSHMEFISRSRVEFVTHSYVAFVGHTEMWRSEGFCGVV